jgi:hypothetical protein
MRLGLPFLPNDLSRKISWCDNHLANDTRDTDASLRGHLWRNVETTGRSCFTRFFFAPFRLDATWKFTPLLEFTRKLCDLTRFDRRSMAVLILCLRLTESDVTVTPSVTCVGWLRWCYNHVAHVVLPSTALAIGTKMREKRKSALPSAVPFVKSAKDNQYWLDVISRLEKGERIVDIWRNVRFVRIGLRTISDDANRITEISKSGCELFV